jgi:putative membrane protein
VTDPRFPRSVYEVGTEPDPRFTMANERTFLAWIRTALALIAGGVALEALGLPLQPALRLAASILLLGLGLVAPLLAWRAWVATEAALRQNAPLPSSGLALLLAIGVTAVAVLIVLGIFLR